MDAKQSNPLYPSRALRADPSADDSSVGEDNLSGVVFSNERPHSAESKGGFFNLEHYLRDHERRMSTPERPPGGYLHDPARAHAAGAPQRLEHRDEERQVARRYP